MIQDCVAIFKQAWLLTFYLKAGRISVWSARLRKAPAPCGATLAEERAIEKCRWLVWGTDGEAATMVKY